MQNTPFSPATVATTAEIRRFAGVATAFPLVATVGIRVGRCYASPGRAAPYHRPNNGCDVFDLYRAGQHRSGLAWDKWVSRGNAAISEADRTRGCYCALAADGVGSGAHGCGSRVRGGVGCAACLPQRQGQEKECVTTAQGSARVLGHAGVGSRSKGSTKPTRPDES